MRMACVFLALLLNGCGGSSSETPPPLEPDPTSLRYSGPRLPSAEDDSPAAAEAAPEVDEDDLPPGQKPKPARATWGSGRTRSTPAATASAPSASALPAASAPPASSALPPAPASAAPAAPPPAKK